jgi:hypothetical protein
MIYRNVQILTDARYMCCEHRTEDKRKVRMESGASSSYETSRAGSSWLGIEMILRVEEHADEDTPTPGEQEEACGLPKGGEKGPVYIVCILGGCGFWLLKY